MAVSYDVPADKVILVDGPCKVTIKFNDHHPWQIQTAVLTRGNANPPKKKTDEEVA
jgi:hypothetical protein